MPRPEHLPLELLQTFALIVDADGDAVAAAGKLGITQPSISKRLTALRRLTSDPDRQPWLVLNGRRWRLTAEGQRVHRVVADLVYRYEQMERFVAVGRAGKPVVSVACGQQAAQGFVRQAVERLLTGQAGCQVRLSTPRGRVRIEGVAGGQFDLAVVSDAPSTIGRIARREMFIEELFEDRLVLVANPAKACDWRRAWDSLTEHRPAAGSELLGLPFILPEGDAGRRQQFDRWVSEATGSTVDVVLETGGWQIILEFAAAGLGVGLVTQSALAAFQHRRPEKLTVRRLDDEQFRPDAVRLIARKIHGKNEPDLTEWGRKLRTSLLEVLARQA